MRFALLFLVLIFCLPSLRAETPAGFTKGNTLYQEQKFPEAAAAYDEVVRSGNWSPTLFYNLGNAQYRAGDFGRAILSYERALALAPSHPEAEANLRLAREKARALQLPEGRIERWIGYASPAQYTWTAAFAFWLGAFLLVSLFFRKRRSPVLVMGSTLAFGVAILSAFSLWRLEVGLRGSHLAIVTDKAVARVATADNANSVLTLPAGSQVRVRGIRGAWTYVSLPNDQRGWVPSSSVERVRL